MRNSFCWTSWVWVNTRGPTSPWHLSPWLHGGQRRRVLWESVAVFFLLRSQSLLFTTAQLEKMTTKKGGADCQHLVYGIHKTMARTKFPRCILNQAAMAMTVSVCEGPYLLVVQHHMNISISGRLTACLSSTPQPRTDLQRHNYLYPAIPLLSPPYISPPLLLHHFFLPSSPAFVIDR